MSTSQDTSALEAFENQQGVVTIGWVGDGVLYVRMAGVISADVGVAFAARLRALVHAARSVQYFSDARAVDSYDLLARSAFVREVLAQRRKFASIVMLTWAEGHSPASRAVATALGEPLEVLTDVVEFETRLFRAAPLAKRKLDPKTWTRSPQVRTPR